MRSMFIIAVAVCALAGSTLRAQESQIRAGFGISTGQAVPSFLSEDNVMTPLSLTTISIPVYLSRTIRIEPEIGVIVRSQEVTYTVDNETVSAAVTNYRLGLGVHFIIPSLANVEQMALYIGPHFDILPFDYERTSSDPTMTSRTISQTNAIYGLRIGGEYSPVRVFSISAEAGLEYISVGEEKSSESASILSAHSDHWINIMTSIRLRVYFN